MRRNSFPKKTPKGRRSLTPAAVERSGLADHDARPLTCADGKRMTRTLQAKIIRRALVLTQKNSPPATASARHGARLGTGPRHPGSAGRHIPDGHRAQAA